MSHSRRLRSYALGLCASASISACTTTLPLDPASVDEEPLIGGFPADSPVLDAYGLIGFMTLTANRLSGTVSPNCTGALVSSTTVVTAKHCVESFANMSTNQAMVFAVGPNVASPKQIARVVDVESAPGNTGGYVNRGHDVGILHLEQPITGVAFAKLGAVEDDQVGEEFVSIGYGRPDNVSMPTQRLVGSGQLHAVSGKTLEALFGSLEEYVRSRYHIEPIDCSQPRPAGTTPAPTTPPVVVPTPTPSPTTPIVITSADPCSTIARARQEYDSLLLETSAELVIKPAEGDAQPCNGDSGGPLLQKNAAGELVSYGVVSGGGSSAALRCDYGTVYASFKAPEVSEFVQAAQQWTDPCGPLGGRASCDGSVARRCSTQNEGPRRLVEFDCQSIGLGCNENEDGSVACAGGD